MRARRLEFFHLAVEVNPDRVLPEERSSLGSNEHRDRVAPGSLEEEDAIVALDRDLAGDVVDAELGQALPYTT
jgi:hypothetical protein